MELNIWNLTEIIQVLSFQILHSHQKCIILIKVPEKIKEHKLKYLYNPYHLFRMFNVGGLVTGKINALLSLLIFFYSKDPDEYKYHYLIKKALFTEK